MTVESFNYTVYKYQIGVGKIHFTYFQLKLNEPKQKKMHSGISKILAFDLISMISLSMRGWIIFFDILWVDFYYLGFR